MELVLVHPQIPHNTGCAARLAAALGLRLHLVKPLGFSLEDRYLKRAGLDYWPMVDLVVHEDWKHAAEFLQEKAERPLAERIHLLSARGGTSLFQTRFQADGVLVFGSESHGLPASLLAAHPQRRVYIPIREDVRSLNLANVVCLSAYTAMNQAGVPLPENSGGYVPYQGPDAGAQPQDMAKDSST